MSLTVLRADDVSGGGLHTRGARLRPSFALSLAAAFGLNLIALSVFAAAVARWQTPLGKSTPRTTTWITAVQVARADPAPPSQHTFASASAVSKPMVATPEPPPSRGATDAKTAPVASDEGSTVRFYRSGEVDRPAEPDSDWNLDSTALDTVGVETLVFDIFVNRDGKIVACSVLQPATLTEEVRDGLEKRLRETTVRPAVRGGMPVASTRRIEVSVLPSQP